MTCWPTWTPPRAKYDFWRVNWAPKSDEGAALGGHRSPAASSRSRTATTAPTNPSTLLDVVFEVMDKVAGTGPLLNDALEPSTTS